MSKSETKTKNFSPDSVYSYANFEGQNKFDNSSLKYGNEKDDYSVINSFEGADNVSFFVF